MISRDDIPNVLYRPELSRPDMSLSQKDGPFASLIFIIASLELSHWRWTHMPVEEIHALEKREVMPFWHSADVWKMLDRQRFFSHPEAKLRVTELANSTTDLYYMIDTRLDYTNTPDVEERRAAVLKLIQRTYNAVRAVVEVIDHEFVTPQMLQETYTWRTL